MSKATISLRKARDLKKGDVFRLHVHGEVVSADLVADGKLVKVRIALEDRGPRATSGGLGRAAAADAWQPDLEFVDETHEMELLCKPGRGFHLLEWNADGDDQ